MFIKGVELPKILVSIFTVTLYVPRRTIKEVHGNVTVQENEGRHEEDLPSPTSSLLLILQNNAPDLDHR